MDWIASVLCLIGNVVLIKKKSWVAFAIYLVANSIWALYWYLNQEWAAMILVSIFMAQNIWGIVTWKSSIV